MTSRQLAAACVLILASQSCTATYDDALRVDWLAAGRSQYFAGCYTLRLPGYLGA
jgi:hypothetical protein